MRPSPEQLARMPLFRSFSPDQLEAVATLTESRQEEAGTVLVEAGASGYSLFVLQEGTALVTGGDEPIGELGPGDFFGEIALLGQRERTATVTATTPVTLVVMLGSDFRVFERDWPDAAEQMKQAMAERLARSSA
jgi:CRP/FNR family transcriptional regulator, cyclic AMP receptor protein